MKHPTCYLAGPISGLDYNGATEWREAVIADLATAGIVGLSPMRAKDHLRDHYDAAGGFSATCEEYGHLSALSGPRGITTRDRFDATRCDVLLVNLLGAARVSVGTMFEIAWADLGRTPIVVAIEPEGNVHEHAMLREMIGFRCPTLDEAVHTVKAIIGLPERAVGWQRMLDVAGPPPMLDILSGTTKHTQKGS